MSETNSEREEIAFEGVPDAPETEGGDTGDMSDAGSAAETKAEDRRGAEAAEDRKGAEAKEKKEGFLADSGLPLKYLALFLPTFVILGLLVYPLQLRLERALQYPFAMDAEEDYILNQGVELGEGRSIYTPISEEPYVVGNYPPLLPAVLAVAVEPPAENPDALIRARQVVGTFALAAIVALILAAFWRTRQLIPAFLAPLLFVVSYEFYQWFVFVRVDLPALALTLAGLCAFIAIRPRWGAAVAAALFVAAAYAKQTAIFAPAACCLVMLFNDPKRLLWFLPVYLGLGFGGFFTLNALTGGEFYRHLVVYNRNVMDWSAFGAVMRNEIWFFYRWWIAGIAAGAACLAAAWLLGRREYRAKAQAHEPEPGREHIAAFWRPRHDRGMAVAWFALAGLGLLGFAKVGSAANYALEPLAAAALLTADLAGGLMTAGAAGRPAVRRWARAGIVTLGAALLIHAIRLFPFPISPMLEEDNPVRPAVAWVDERNVAAFMFSSMNPGNEDMMMGTALVRAARLAPGEVLAETAMAPLLAGKPVLFQPFIMSELAREGRWDARELLEDIRRLRFGLIVTTEDLRAERKSFRRYTEAMAEAIATHYELKTTLGPGELRVPYYLWVPREVKVRRTDMLLTAEEKDSGPRLSPPQRG